MDSVIVKPKSDILKKYIQYFLFFQKADSDYVNYTTFPNNNLCLAIYRDNKIDYINQSGINSCKVTKGNGNFSSRIYGFHKIPFQVSIESPLDQICIIFYPSALKAFTEHSFKDLKTTDAVFDEIFSKKNIYLLEEIFEEEELSLRAEKLESLLLNNLRYEISTKMKQALGLINSTSSSQNLNIELLFSQLEMSESSLFRLFQKHLGQNPQSYLKTVRFRNSLDEILRHNQSLTEIAYKNQYFDQAHFIKDFKYFSGYSPKRLLNNISVQQSDLVWIYDKN